MLDCRDRCEVASDVGAQWRNIRLAPFAQSMTFRVMRLTSHIFQIIERKFNMREANLLTMILINTVFHCA